MQKEMQEAAEAGFRFSGVMGGETAFRRLGSALSSCRRPKAIAATNIGCWRPARHQRRRRNCKRRATLGFKYRAKRYSSQLSAARSDRDSRTRPCAKFGAAIRVRLVATSKTGTMQKELSEAGDQGFRFVGVTVASTAMGGSEIVSILRRQVGGTQSMRPLALGGDCVACSRRCADRSGRWGERTLPRLDGCPSRERRTAMVRQRSSGGPVRYRILKTERSYNYKLAATSITPDVVRAVARLLQTPTAPDGR